jgi:hypothetical protein
MGQGASTSKETLELFTKQQLTQLIYATAIVSFDVVDIKSLSSHLNVSAIDPQQTVCLEQLRDLFQFPSQFEFAPLLQFLKLVGSGPFFRQYDGDDLSLQLFIVAAWFLTGKSMKRIPNFNYTKLIFLALALSTSLPQLKELDTSKGDELQSTRDSELQDPIDVEKKSPPVGDRSKDVYSIAVSEPTSEHDSVNEKATKLIWSTFAPIVSFDNIEVTSLTLNGEVLSQFLTFMIIINYTRINSFNNDQLAVLLDNWNKIQPLTVSLLRYFNIDIDAKTLADLTISYAQFEYSVSNLFPTMFIDNFKYLFNNRVFTFRVPGSEINQDLVNKKTVFKESKLISNADMTMLSFMINNLTTSIELGQNNMVRLFSGSESGFSIRSIEQNIFKWRAPTIFFVSGKRLKSKTIAKNKRYHTFIEEYPRYFTSSETPLCEWQHSNDTIVYAVLVTEPWKNSNKRNFGDENSIIFSIHPRFDFYKSRRSDVLKGKLVYFNNSGFGIGFGNDQPMNKHNVRRYVPGNVSLTIEPNLEFAVFRHLTAASPNSNTYFQTSKQELVQSENFEDRFLINDVEVWGVGSTKQLEEQRKQWEWENKQAEARRSVNMRNISEDRAFLEMVGLVGNNQFGGSV